MANLGTFNLSILYRNIQSLWFDGKFIDIFKSNGHSRFVRYDLMANLGTFNLSKFTNVCSLKLDNHFRHICYTDDQ